MDMKINAPLIVEYRKQKAWSQQHLADVSGLSLRTVQRIENNGTASQDSVKAIANAFGLIPADLIEHNPISQPTPSAVKNKRQSFFLPLSLAATITLGASIWFTAASYQSNGDTPTVSKQQGPQDEAVNKSGLVLLAHIDKGEYATSWQKSASYFQSQITEQQWIQALDSVRTPLGEVESRSVISQQLTTVLPSLPDGEYATLTLATNFTHKPQSVETLTMSKVNDQWLLIGYFIR